MSKKQQKAATPAVSVGISGRVRRHKRHLRNHPNDEQARTGFKPDRVKKKPQNKLGWTHSAFKHVPVEIRKNLHTKSDCVAYAKILKLRRIVENEIRYRQPSV